ncbi:hypothetical protein HS041_27120 [Planomonospora sp. ID67723]|uniref:hypothetical protein n=1 Tax=Planomonospora sp. ID67723 TaxID=2738134 RepID=UPI0018C3721D|nr:hypothetical protein [Planomonospora sp. ID67723]MBG0831423.1 hypothetical protein [Planomonospora sp. ID67723]
MSTSDPDVLGLGIEALSRGEAFVYADAIDKDSWMVLSLSTQGDIGAVLVSGPDPEPDPDLDPGPSVITYTFFALRAGESWTLHSGLSGGYMPVDITSWTAERLSRTGELVYEYGQAGYAERSSGQWLCCAEVLCHPQVKLLEGQSSAGLTRATPSPLGIALPILPADEYVDISIKDSNGSETGVKRFHGESL